MPRDVTPARGPASAIEFCIDESMVRAFAALTGDHSSLHVDPDAARRSAFRRPIVHGMLPVAFIARTAALSAGPAALSALSGRFLGPVYAGDRLRLVTTPGAADDAGRLAYEFEVLSAATGAAVTTGAFSVTPGAFPEESAGNDAGERGGEPAAMPTEPLTLQHPVLEDIERGRRDQFGFTVSAAAARALDAILDGGMREPATASTRAQAASLPNLMAVLAYSTSVGVLLPGAAATFLEFTARIERPVPWDTPLRLEAEVVHRSRGTRIVKKTMRVVPADDPATALVEGKVAALVNPPSSPMPSVEDLRSGGLDLGLAGRVVLVTGSSRGIGETIAKLFALAGARVVVNYLRGARDAERVVGEIVAAGGEAMAVGADVADASAVAAMFSAVRDRFGSVDVLVNNAVRDFRPISFATLTWDDIQRDIDVVVKGAFLCCQQAIPAMRERGRGKIVNLSSVAVDDPPPDQAKYVTAKSALVGLTRSLSVELAPHNIQVNLVAPHFVETDLVAHVTGGFRSRIAASNPTGRLATPLDVARAVLFLASTWSDFTTGQKLLVTGGGAPYA